MEAARKSTDPAPPRQATSAAVISAVCGSNDLLHEILLRLDFPTDLVCAAAVSKRWLQGASDGTFLRRFRHLHPPRLLGFYVCTSGSPLRFVPLPQPPELAAVIRRGNFELGDNSGSVLDCRNGRLLIYAHGKLVVCSPLHSERGTAILPQNKGVFGSWPMKAIPNFVKVKTTVS
uniref:F-box domain-containing protein n=1 Tax=Arundo donax TaxID=35708 RepID=A0A0A8XYX4_ARUDO